jgi:hypothetical protein
MNMGIFGVKRGLLNSFCPTVCMYVHTYVLLNQRARPIKEGLISPFSACKFFYKTLTLTFVRAATAVLCTCYLLSHVGALQFCPLVMQTLIVKNAHTGIGTFGW